MSPVRVVVSFVSGFLWVATIALLLPCFSVCSVFTIGIALFGRLFCWCLFAVAV